MFLAAVMEQGVDIRFCVKLGKTLTESYQILQTVYGGEAVSHSNVFTGLNDLMMGERFISMIQEVGVLQPLKMLYPSESKANIPA
jgi:hypothetical protein